MADFRRQVQFRLIWRFLAAWGVYTEAQIQPAGAGAEFNANPTQSKSFQSWT